MFAPRGWLKRPGATRIYRTLARSELFQPSWYRSTQLQGLARWRDPLWHYLDHGWQQGLDPSPHFDSSYYVEQNDDVRRSKLNPLFHYLEYGKAERRSPIRSVQQTFDVFFPEAKELETFVSPRVGEQRLTLLIDHETLRRIDYSLTELAQACLSFAQQQGRDARIISYLEDSSWLRHSVATARVSINFDSRNLELVLAGGLDSASSFEIYRDELFVASSWTSCLALRHTAPENNTRVLKPVTEGGPNPELAGSIKVFGNSWALSLGENPTAQESRRLPSSGTLQWISPPQNMLHLVIFADVNGYRLDYVRVLRALESLAFEGNKVLNHVCVTVVGEALDPVTIAENMVPRTVDHLPTGYQNLIDLAIMAVPNVGISEGLLAHGVELLDGTSSGLANRLPGFSVEPVTVENIRAALKAIDSNDERSKR